LNRGDVRTTTHELVCESSRLPTLSSTAARPARILLMQCDAMAVERRRLERRRPPPGQHADVTRLEHENLCKQMDAMFQMLRRIEAELQAQRERIGALEALTQSARRVDLAAAPPRGATGR